MQTHFNVNISQVEAISVHDAIMTEPIPKPVATPENSINMKQYTNSKTKYHNAIAVSKKTSILIMLGLSMF